MGACNYANKHSERLAGIVLLASYPNVDISQSGLPVLSLTASEDKVLNREAYEAARDKLPPTAVFTTIQGGNHARFGSYGEQKNDGQATISRQEQRATTVQAIIDNLL